MQELLLEKEYEQIAENMINGISFFLPGFEGTKEEGLRLGCKQYIILASGYDTFSLRNEDKTLSVFEMDLPELLADKMQRIKRMGKETDTVFVPCNLAESTWMEKLLQSGYRPMQKSFGSLLGISYYLSKEEFQSLLQRLSQFMAKGSAICFDYPSKEDSLESRTNRQLAKEAGEHMKAMYSDLELEEVLSSCGFEKTMHLNQDEITRQYFADYNNCNKAQPMKAPAGVGYILAKKK